MPLYRGKNHIVLSLAVLITNPDRRMKFIRCGFDLLHSFRSSDLRALPPRGEIRLAKMRLPASCRPVSSPASVKCGSAGPVKCGSAGLLVCGSHVQMQTAVVCGQEPFVHTKR